MNPALRYLLAHSFLNGIRMRLLRLRQPKYLAAAVFAGLYFYFYFYKFLFGGHFLKGPQLIPDALWPHVGSAMLLVAMIFFSWIIPASRAAIGFTEAEIAFLFPAPVSRRTLVIHKLLKSQLTLLVLAVLITLITGRFRAGSEAWYRMGGWWIILNTLNLHRIGASFALQRFRERGMSDWKRRAAALLTLGGIGVGCYFFLGTLPPPPVAPPGEMPNYAGYILEIATRPPISHVLSPFRWLVQPYFARDLTTFLQVLGPALALLFLHFLWVVRADVSFEEASIVAAQKRAALISAHRRGEFRVKRATKAARALWPLSPTGFAPVAFLWKAFLKFGGRRTFLFWSTLFAVLFFAANIARDEIRSNPSGPIVFVTVAICVICYLTLLISLVMIGQQASAQLRQAMGSLDLVKTYPIPGWQIALGELFGAVAIGSLLQWAALLVAAFLLSGFIGKMPNGITYLSVGTAALGILLPAFNIATSILPSGAALMFPGWFRPQDATGPGVENTGMRLMVGIAQILALAIALLPVGFFGVCAWFALGHFEIELMWRAVSAVGVGAVILAMEAALGIAWLGHLYDTFDLSQSS